MASRNQMADIRQSKKFDDNYSRWDIIYEYDGQTDRPTDTG